MTTPQNNMIFIHLKISALPYVFPCSSSFFCYLPVGVTTPDFLSGFSILLTTTSQAQSKGFSIPKVAESLKWHHYGKTLAAMQSFVLFTRITKKIG